MGLLDGLLPGAGPAYKQPVLELEGVVGAWTAARTGAGLSISGGQVVLARDYLVFSPWDMDGTRAWLVKWLPKAGVPGVAQVDKLLSATKVLDPVVIPLADIAGVQELNRASLFKPPQVRIELRAGGHFDLGILASPGTMNPSPKNNAELDEFLSKLRPALG